MRQALRSGQTLGSAQHRACSSSEGPHGAVGAPALSELPAKKLSGAPTVNSQPEGRRGQPQASHSPWNVRSGAFRGRRAYPATPLSRRLWIWK